jgi:hypothetical protein
MVLSRLFVRWASIGFWHVLKGFDSNEMVVGKRAGKSVPLTKIVGDSNPTLQSNAILNHEFSKNSGLNSVNSKILKILIQTINMI